jgi:hypothetical protein
MTQWEYKVLILETLNSELSIKIDSGGDSRSRALMTQRVSDSIEEVLNEVGEHGYELKRTNVIGETIYLFLMRKKK